MRVVSKIAFGVWRAGWGWRAFATLITATALIAASHAQQIGPPAQPACADCDSATFICNDNPAKVGDQKIIQTGKSLWLPDGADCWKLYEIDFEIEEITLTLCDLSKLVVWRVNNIYLFATEYRYCLSVGVPVPAFPEKFDPGNIGNPYPVSGQPPGATPPSLGPTLSKNCHGVSLGFCPPFSLPPGTPGPPGPSTPGAAIPAGGTWINDPTPVTGGPSRQQVECVEPPDGGVIVMVYCAKELPGPTLPGAPPLVDPATISAVHSATSNGDGTYTSKNGMREKDGMATEEEAFGEYLDPDNWEEEYVCYKICYEKI